MKQIAVVEDEPLMREELAMMLRKAGYKAIEIREFDHVAEQLEQISPDLAVLDLNLPGCQRISDLPGDQRKKLVPGSCTDLPGSDER